MPIKQVLELAHVAWWCFVGLAGLMACLLILINLRMMRERDKPPM